MIGVRIILVLFLFTAASGQQPYFNYSLTPVTVELEDIVMNILDKLALHVDESNCILKLVKIFETLMKVVDGIVYLFNIQIFCPDNKRSRVCTNVQVLKQTNCIGKNCLTIINPHDIECIIILTGENSLVSGHYSNYGNYSLTPVTIEIREVVLEILGKLSSIVQEPNCTLELVNIFSAVAQVTLNVTNYMFDIEVYCPSSKVSIVCANVKVYKSSSSVLFKDPLKIRWFTIKTGHNNSASGYNYIVPFTIGMNKTILKVLPQLPWAIRTKCRLEFVKVFEAVVKNIGDINKYMFNIEAYCPSSNVSKVCTNVKVDESITINSVKLVELDGIKCSTIKTDNYSLTPITIEIKKVVLEILHPLAPIVKEPDCKLRLINIFVAVAKVIGNITYYIFDINVYCPSSKVSKVCTSVHVNKNQRNHSIINKPLAIQCYKINTDNSTIFLDSKTTPPQIRPNTPDIGLFDGSGHDYDEIGPHGGSSSGRRPHPGSSSGREPHGGSSSGREPHGGSSSGRRPHGGSFSGRRPHPGSSSGREPHGGSSFGRGPTADPPSGEDLTADPLIFPTDWF